MKRRRYTRKSSVEGRGSRMEHISIIIYGMLSDPVKPEDKEREEANDGERNVLFQSRCERPK